MWGVKNSAVIARNSSFLEGDCTFIKDIRGIRFSKNSTISTACRFSRVERFRRVVTCSAVDLRVQLFVAYHLAQPFLTSVFG